MAFLILACEQLMWGAFSSCKGWKICTVCQGVVFLIYRGALRKSPIFIPFPFQTRVVEPIYRIIINFRLHLNLKYISCPTKCKILLRISLRFNKWSSNWKSVVFNIATRFSKSGIQSIFQIYRNVIKNILTGNSDFCRYSSFDFQYYLHKSMIYLILHKSPEEKVQCG